MSTETNLVNRFIVSVVRGEPDFGTVLPGGVWKGNAPADASYPFLTFTYAAGSNALAINSAGTDYIIGAGLQYLLKVTDRSESDAKADEAAAWVEQALHQNQGMLVEGGYVYCQKEFPYDLPILEQDIKYQQIGGTYRFWVDRP